MLKNLVTIRNLLLIKPSSLHKSILCNPAFSFTSNKNKSSNIDNRVHSQQNPESSLSTKNNSTATYEPKSTAIDNKKTSPQKKLKFHESLNSLDIKVKPKLEERLNKLKIKPRKSIFMDEYLEDGQDELEVSDGKLSRFQKQKLDLFIPDPPFPARMTRSHEQEYRKALSEDLYEKQQQQLEVSARILQLSGNRNEIVNFDQNKCTIEEYVNIIYKDIFARYLVNHGVGVDWLGKKNYYGVMNPAPTHKQIAKDLTFFYKWLFTLLEYYPAKIVQSLYLYSYSTKKYVPLSASKVQIEDIYRIGHYLTLPITDFNIYEENFREIKQRQQKIQLLVFVDDLAKILNAKGLIVEQGTYIILKKYSDKEQEGDNLQKAEYLITSMDIFSAHRQFMKNQGYEKHSLFKSKYILGMEAEIKKYGGSDSNETLKLKLYPEIEGYRRKCGIYMFDSQTSLGDRERAEFYGLIEQKQADIIDQSGNILLNHQPIGILINDPKYQEKLIQKLDINIFPLHGTFEDQIYSYYFQSVAKYQKLHFRRINRYNIDIPNQNTGRLISALWGSPESQFSTPLISESKVTVPRMKPFYHKKRDKRRHLKQIKELKNQETIHMTLRQSIQSLTQLTLDDPHHIQTQPGNIITVPLIVLTHKKTKIQNLLPLTKQITQILMNNVGLSEEKQVLWNHSVIIENVTKFLSKKNLEMYDLQVRQIVVSKKIIQGWQCLKDCLQQQQQKKSNIIIEPQQKTQTVIPNFLHLFLMTKRYLYLQSQKSKKGRRTSANTPKELPISQIAQMFSLIKLHPTMDQVQGIKSVNQLLFGVMKLNSREQHGYGLEAFRLWILKRDAYKGNRTITEKEINDEIKFSAFLRKLYWQILPLMQVGQNYENKGEKKVFNYDQMTYLHRFMADHINYYLCNMETAFKSLSLTDAYLLTQDFFQNYVHQIFVKTVRHRMITYPNNIEQNNQSKQILRRIISLLPLLQVLIPYSVYHITKQSMLPWPELNSNYKDSNDDESIYKLRPQLIPNYNRMTKFRVQFRNRLLLNNFDHSELVIKEDLIPEYNLSDIDLELFFNVSNISVGEPSEKQRSFRMKLKHKHPLGQEIKKIEVYKYEDVCFRCAPKSIERINNIRIRKGQPPLQKYLCTKCLSYLNTNVDKLLPI